MKYEQIVFDIDGTLLDTEYAVLHSFQHTLEVMAGLRMELEELTFCLGITGEDALVRLQIENIPETLAFWEKELRNYNEMVSAFDGIMELLQQLKEKDYELGIVTSKKRSEFEKEFKKVGIRDYFKTVICADDTKEHKPAAGPLLKYMELSGSDRGRLLYIGDSEYDSKCAENAKVDFALAGWGSHSKSIPTKYYLDIPGDLWKYI